MANTYTKQELKIIQQFMSWLQNDETKEKFNIRKKYYPLVDLKVEEVLEEGFLVDSLENKINKFPEFFEYIHIDGNKGKIKVLTKEGSNFIHQNLLKFGEYVSYNAIFIQDITLKDSNGNSIVGGQISLSKDFLNYWENINIMFSTDVNVDTKNAKENEKKTKKNRKNYLKKVSKAIRLANKEYPELRGGYSGDRVEAYSLIKMDGCYQSFEGKTFIERSYSMSLIQVPQDLGILLSKKIREVFCQESVLISIGSKNMLIGE